jgi:hypothetical protein
MPFIFATGICIGIMLLQNYGIMAIGDTGSMVGVFPDKYLII